MFEIFQFDKLSTHSVDGSFANFLTYNHCTILKMWWNSDDSSLSQYTNECQPVDDVIDWVKQTLVQLSGVECTHSCSLSQKCTQTSSSLMRIAYWIGEPS